MTEREIGVLLEAIESLKKGQELIHQTINSNAKKLEEQEAKLAAQDTKIAVLSTTTTLWFKVLGFIAAVVVPSIWIIVLTTILNPSTSSKMVSFIPFIKNL